MKSKSITKNSDKPIEVSVCCLAYNHEKYIEQTLEGFVNQVTDFRFEIIINDDVSTDGTREIIEKYAGLYPDIIVPVFQTENQYSKRKGAVPHILFSAARGTYVALCEGDDYWCDEHKLQKQYEIMEQYQECSICVHRTKVVMEDKEMVKKSNIGGGGTKKSYDLQTGVIERMQMADALWRQGGYPFHTSSYFIRRRALEDWIQNKAAFTAYMNGDLTMLRFCLTHGKFYFLDEIMSCRRIGVSQSWSVRWAAAGAEEKKQSYKQLIEGERLFDQYSGYEFHGYIQVHLFNLIAEYCLYDAENSKKYIRENPLSIKIIKDKDTLRIYMRYLILRISPKLYKWLNDRLGE